MIRQLPGWSLLTAADPPADLERRIVRLESFGWACDSVESDTYTHVEADLYRRHPGCVTLSRLHNGHRVEARGESLHAAVAEAEQLQRAIFPHGDRYLRPRVPVQAGVISRP